MTQNFKIRLTVIAVLAALLVSGCSQFRNITGVGKNPPDEFAVVERPNLILPPEFELAPPDPADPSPQDLASAADTLRALFPDRTNVTPQTSAGEDALIRNIEARPLTEVRSQVEDRETEVVEKGTLLDEIIEGPERDGEIDNSRINHVSSEDEDG